MYTSHEINYYYGYGYIFHTLTTVYVSDGSVWLLTLGLLSPQPLMRRGKHRRHLLILLDFFHWQIFCILFALVLPIVVLCCLKVKGRANHPTVGLSMYKSPSDTVVVKYSVPYSHQV